MEIRIEDKVSTFRGIRRLRVEVSRVSRIAYAFEFEILVQMIELLGE